MTKKAIIPFSLLTIIGAGLLFLFPLNKPTADDILYAEQEVYSFLLDEKNLHTKKYLIEYTNAGEIKGHIPIDFAGFSREIGLDDFPEMQEETWIDYQEKNKVSYPVENYLSSTKYLTLVNYDNRDQLNEWVSFSRIGFNQSLSQALVLIGDCSGEACFDNTSNYMLSVGYFVFLEKKNGKWTILGQPRIWFVEAPSP